MHKLFQLVPEIQKKEFNQFLDKSKEKKVQIGDYCWNYRIFDEYGSWIILLPGFRYTASIYYQYAFRLARRFKVLVLDFPVLNNVEEIMSAFSVIIEKENIDNFSIIGFSDFGFMAPLLAERFYEKCSHAVFNNVVINSETMPRQLRESLIAGYEKSEKKLKFSTQGAVSKRVHKQWEDVSARIIGEELFWQTYFKAESSVCTKESEETYYSLVKDFLNNYRTGGDILRNSKCLFIDVINEADPVRKDLSIVARDFFLDLKIIEERNSGDAALLSRKTSLINAIEDFIKDGAADVQDD